MLISALLGWKFVDLFGRVRPYQRGYLAFQGAQRDSRLRRPIGVLSVEAGPAAKCSPPTRMPPTALCATRREMGTTGLTAGPVLALKGVNPPVRWILLCSIQRSAAQALWFPRGLRRGHNARRQRWAQMQTQLEAVGMPSQKATWTQQRRRQAIRPRSSSPRACHGA